MCGIMFVGCEWLECLFCLFYNIFGGMRDQIVCFVCVT